MSSSAMHRISYQKNSYADEAYQQFSKLLDEARAAYASGFQAVCEEVYNGLSEYCILPVENSAEGRLGSFARLIRRYDLKIAATCDVQTDEDKITRFALLRKSIAEISAPAELPRYFEFSCELTEDLQMNDLLTAAELCGLVCETADVSGRDKCLHAVLREGQGDLPAFLLDLAMEAPHAVPMGLFSHLHST